MTRMTMPTVLAATLLLAAAGSAVGQKVVAGAYAGGGGALFGHDEPLERTPCGSRCDEEAGPVAIKLYGGYRLDDFWSFEAAYSDTEPVQDSVEGALPGIGFVAGTAEAQFDALSLRAIRHVPLFWGSFIIGAGYFTGRWDSLLEVSDGVEVLRFEDTSTEEGLTATVGLQWDFPVWSLRIEYEWWDIEEADPTQVAFAAHYRFGTQQRRE